MSLTLSSLLSAHYSSDSNILCQKIRHFNIMHILFQPKTRTYRTNETLWQIIIHWNVNNNQHYTHTPKMKTKIPSKSDFYFQIWTKVLKSRPKIFFTKNSFWLCRSFEEELGYFYLSLWLFEYWRWEYRTKRNNGKFRLRKFAYNSVKINVHTLSMREPSTKPVYMYLTSYDWIHSHAEC